MKEIINHPFAPIYDSCSKVLILGSLPSLKSREIGFYYGHPRNRFWTVLSKIYEEDFPTISEKVIFLKKHHIALWDVIKCCEIHASSDATITNVEANDLVTLIQKTKIQYIITTGKKADQLYQKYCFKKTNIPSICLPSTSPANCAFKEEQLIKAYQKIKELTD